jgi:hypothetical protein
MAYGNARKLGFAGLVIGFLMCLVGVIAPFWLDGYVIYRGYLVHITTGLWWGCADYALTTSCDYIDIDDQDYVAKVWVYRIASIFCGILSLSAVAVEQSRIRGNYVGKSVGQGITMFLAGAAGVVTITVFDAFLKEGSNASSSDIPYAWAFYIYIVGTSFLVISSLVFLFAPPDSTAGQVFTGAQMGTVMVSASGQQVYGAPQYPNPGYNWQQQPQNVQQYVERKQAY